MRKSINPANITGAEKNYRGAGAEHIAMGHWLIAGFPVAVPLTRKERYDFSVEVEGSTHLVECKLGHFRSDHKGSTIRADLRSSDTGLNKVCEDISLIQVVHPVTYASYLVPATEAIGQKAIGISCSPSSQFHSKKYTFLRTLNRLLAIDDPWVE